VASSLACLYFDPERPNGGQTKVKVCSASRTERKRLDAQSLLARRLAESRPSAASAPQALVLEFDDEEARLFCFFLLVLKDSIKYVPGGKILKNGPYS
jgi:hypothetical protein